MFSVRKSVQFVIAIRENTFVFVSDAELARALFLVKDIVFISDELIILIFRENFLKKADQVPNSESIAYGSMYRV